MLTWLRSLFKQPEPAGPSQQIRAFAPSERPLSQDGVAADEGGWRLEARDARTVRLFEAPVTGVEQALLVYRARLKTAEATGRVYLEMWCRIPGRGDFFSKGFHHAVQGTTDWGSYEVPFYLRAGQRPDLLKLNVVCEGTGTVWVRDVELLKTPLR